MNKYKEQKRGVEQDGRMHRPLQVGDRVVASRGQANAAGVAKHFPFREYGAGGAEDYYHQQHPATPDSSRASPQPADRASSTPPSRSHQPRRGVLATGLAAALEATADLPSPPAHLVCRPPQPGSISSRPTGRNSLWVEASHHSGTAQLPGDPQVRSFNRYQNATRAATASAPAGSTPAPIRRVADSRHHATQGRLDPQRPAEIGPWKAAAQPPDSVISYFTPHVIYAVVPTDPNDGCYVGQTAKAGGTWERHRRRREDKAFKTALPASELSPFEAHMREQGEEFVLHGWTLMPLEVVPPLQGAPLEEWRAARRHAQRLQDVRLRGGAAAALAAPTAPASGDMAMDEWQIYARPFEKFWVDILRSRRSQGGWNTEYDTAAARHAATHPQRANPVHPAIAAKRKRQPALRATATATATHHDASGEQAPRESTAQRRRRAYREHAAGAAATATATAPTAASASAAADATAATAAATAATATSAAASAAAAAAAADATATAAADAAAAAAAAVITTAIAARTAATVLPWLPEDDLATLTHTLLSDQVTTQGSDIVHWHTAKAATASCLTNAQLEETVRELERVGWARVDRQYSLRVSVTHVAEAIFYRLRAASRQTGSPGFTWEEATSAAAPPGMGPQAFRAALTLLQTYGSLEMTVLPGAPHLIAFMRLAPDDDDHAIADLPAPPTLLPADRAAILTHTADATATAAAAATAVAAAAAATAAAATAATAAVALASAAPGPL